jgi:PAS domain S-box-containing protein
MLGRVKLPNAFNLMIFIIVSIFAAETIIMLLMASFTKDIPPTVKSIIDSSLLTAVIFPSLYLLLYRPMRMFIAERGNVEKILLNAKEDWENTFDSITEIITIHDNDFNIIRANKTAKEKLALPSSLDGYVKCFKYYHGTDSPPEGCKSCECLKTGKPGISELFDSHLNMYIEIKAIPRLGNNNRIEGSIHVIRNITDKKRLEKTLIKGKEDWERTFDSIEDLIMLSDAEGRILRVNKAFANKVGLEFKEIIGSYCYEIVHGTNEPPEYCPGPKMLPDHKIQKAEFHEPRLGGYYHLSIYPYFNSDGRFMGAIHVARDITEKRMADKAIRESEEKYRALINDANDAIFIVDMEGNVTDANRKAEEYTGYERKELVGVHFAKLHPAEDCETAAGSYAVELEKGSGRYLEVPFQKKDGGIFFADISVNRIEYAGKKIVQVIASDITELKKARNALRESEEKLRRAERLEAIGKLTAGVAHEVRNPLNAIMALTDALFMDIGDDPEYQQYRLHIRLQVNRLSELMSDLLELGRPSEPSKIKRNDLLELCSNVVDLWKKTGIGKAYKVEMAQPPNARAVEVLCEGQRLQQVFLNLLDNAAQHSPKGSKILLAVLEPFNSTVKVQAIDWGAGVPPEALPRVFDPFYTLRKRGTGLGLSIVKTIVENIGGSMEIFNNDTPPGCTAEVSLPVAENGVK